MVMVIGYCLYPPIHLDCGKSTLFIWVDFLFFLVLLFLHTILRSRKRKRNENNKIQSIITLILRSTEDLIQQSMSIQELCIPEQDLSKQMSRLQHTPIGLSHNRYTRGTAVRGIWEVGHTKKQPVAVTHAALAWAFSGRSSPTSSWAAFVAP